jgi:hypothetical protein
MAGKTINVKVSRVKIIDALQNKLDNLNKLNAEHQEAEKKFEKDLEAWKFEVAEIAIKSDKAVHKGTSVMDRYYDDHSSMKEIEIYVSVPKDLLPEKPERPVNPIEPISEGRYYVSTYKEQARAIENAIRILKLSDEEVVNTSTYNSVSKFL